jgi:RNA recognition motif-containing protein
LKFKDRKAAEAAIKELDGLEWMDKKLRVEWAFLTGPFGSKA